MTKKERLVQKNLSLPLEVVELLEELSETTNTPQSRIVENGIKLYAERTGKTGIK